MKSIILNSDRGRGRVVAYLHEDGQPEEQFINQHGLSSYEVVLLRNAVRLTAAACGFIIKGTES
jgi:hypothetical protein